MRILRFVMFVCLISAPLQAGLPEPSDHPEYETVKAVIEDSIGWAIDKDLDRLFQIFADDDAAVHRIGQRAHPTVVAGV